MLSRFLQLWPGAEGAGSFWQGGILLAVFVFQVWMLIDAIRRKDYLWAVFIFIGYGLSAVLYYFMVYRASGGGNPLAGFELPGASDRKQIKELQASIYHLDKPHHYLQLADIYLAQGKLDEAEKNYRAAYQRDQKDPDIRAHLGNCLLRRGKREEALPLLSGVCAENPKHDYGYTLMTLAETQEAAKQTDEALVTWKQVMGLYSYSRARVQYANLLIKRGVYAEAKKYLEEVINDAPFGTKFQRKREAVWVRRAQTALRLIPKARKSA